MNEVLEVIGLQMSFVPFAADFSGLVKDNELPLFISEVRQRVRIIVDKDGTEASAVTMVTQSSSSVSMEEPKEPLILTFNSPYIYVMYERITCIPLFIGLVDNPM